MKTLWVYAKRRETFLIIINKTATNIEHKDGETKISILYFLIKESPAMKLVRKTEVGFFYLMVFIAPKTLTDSEKLKNVLIKPDVKMKN